MQDLGLPVSLLRRFWGSQAPQHPTLGSILGVSTSSESSQPTLGRFGGYWRSLLSAPGS